MGAAYPGMGSEDRTIIELLEIIAQNTGGIGDVTVQEGDELTEIDAPGAGGSVGVLDPGRYRLYETDDLPDSNEDGTVTLQPGQSRPIVEYEAHAAQGVNLLAVGANDEPDVTYGLIIDNDLPVGGRTNSPLGLVNEPFSFVQKYNAVIPASQKVEYWAYHDPEAEGNVDLVGRLHVEEQ